MAKKDSLITLCVSEYKRSDSLDIGWRPIADYYEPRKRFVSLGSDEPHITFGKPAIYEVAVLDFAEDRKLPNGDKDIRVLSHIPVIEVVEPREFRNIFLEDTEKVRNILRNGFTITEVSRASFAKEQTQLAVAIQSATGMKRAFLIKDKSKFSIEKNDDYSSHRFTVTIAGKPEDKKKFIESIDVIDIETNPTISYKYNEESMARVFLSSAPKVVSKFLPYSSKDFAPIFFKRQLNLAKQNIALSSGRKLANADVNAILDSIEASLKNEDEFRALVKVEDPAVAKELISGIKEMLPDIKRDIQQDSDLVTGIRGFLLRDNDIRQECINGAKEQWMSAKDAERDSKQKELAELDKQIAAKTKETSVLDKKCSDLAAKLKSLDKDYADREAAIDRVSEKLQAAVAEYRNDVARLVMETGCSNYGSLPLVIPGENLNCDSIDGALAHNLSSFLSFETARGLFHYIGMALGKGLHFAVPGEHAHLVANAISVAFDGRTANVVACADENCSIHDLKRAVETTSGSVVLVEGVLGSESDSKALALARHCCGKILVYSIDDGYNMKMISGTVFSRIALIDNLKLCRPKLEITMKKAANQIEVNTFNAVNAVWVPSNNPDTDAFIQRQMDMVNQ